VLGEFEAGVPAGRRAEVLAGLIVLPELVVGGALFGVGEDLVGLVDLFHAFFGVRLLGDVRMVFARELAVGLLDFVGGRLARHAQRPVVVPEFHAISCCLDYASRNATMPLGFTGSGPLDETKPLD